MGATQDRVSGSTQRLIDEAVASLTAFIVEAGEPMAHERAVRMLAALDSAIDMAREDEEAGLD